MYIVGEQHAASLRSAHPGIVIAACANPSYVYVDPDSLPEAPLESNPDYWSLRWLYDNMGKNPVVYAETDYFGGMGDQFARAIGADGEMKEFTDNINGALEHIGMQRPVEYGSDLFDWVGLGNVRTNSDVFDKKDFELVSIGEETIKLNISTQEESKPKTGTIRLENIKRSDGWHGWLALGHQLGLSNERIYEVFEHGEYGNIEIIVDADLNIIGGKIIPFKK